MNYYLNQKKTLEVNPRHPLIKDLLRRIEDSKDDKTALVRSSPSESFAMVTRALLSRISPMSWLRQPHFDRVTI